MKQTLKTIIRNVKSIKGNSLAAFAEKANEKIKINDKISVIIKYFMLKSTDVCGGSGL